MSPHPSAGKGASPTSPKTTVSAAPASDEKLIPAPMPLTEKEIIRREAKGAVSPFVGVGHRGDYNEDQVKVLDRVLAEANGQFGNKGSDAANAESLRIARADIAALKAITAGGVVKKTESKSSQLSTPTPIPTTDVSAGLTATAALEQPAPSPTQTVPSTNRAYGIPADLQKDREQNQNAINAALAERFALVKSGGDLSSVDKKVESLIGTERMVLSQMKPYLDAEVRRRQGSSITALDAPPPVPQALKDLKTNLENETAAQLSQRISIASKNGETKAIDAKLVELKRTQDMVAAQLKPFVDSNARYEKEVESQAKRISRSNPNSPSSGQTAAAGSRVAPAAPALTDRQQQAKTEREQHEIDTVYGGLIRQIDRQYADNERLKKAQFQAASKNLGAGGIAKEQTGSKTLPYGSFPTGVHAPTNFLGFKIGHHKVELELPSQDADSQKAQSRKEIAEQFASRYGERIKITRSDTAESIAQKLAEYQVTGSVTTPTGVSSLPTDSEVVDNPPTPDFDDQ